MSASYERAANLYYRWRRLPKRAWFSRLVLRNRLDQAWQELDG